MQPVEHWILLSTGADLGLKATPTEPGSWIYHPSGLKVRITNPIPLVFEGAGCTGKGYVFAPVSDLKQSHALVSADQRIIQVAASTTRPNVQSWSAWSGATVCTDYGMVVNSIDVQSFVDTGLSLRPRLDAEIDVELR